MIDVAQFLRSREPRGWIRKRLPLPVDWPRRPSDYRTPGKYFFYRDQQTGEPATGEILRLKLDARNTLTAVIDRRGEPIAVIAHHAETDTWTGTTFRHRSLERRTDVECGHALLTEPP